MIDYDERCFVPLANSENGEVTPDVVFRYKQEGRIITCTYAGGRIERGHLIALVDDEGGLDMRYHQVNERGELMTGICRSTPEVLPDGRIRLHESWRWTSGDRSAGTSILEEV
ncbi:MAG: n-acetylglutamate synthase [Flavobacteriales bacterium]